jgi:O-methyltransferase
MTTESMITLIQEWIEQRRSFFKQAFLALKVSEITGDYVEFGSWGGQSLKAAYDVLQITSPERQLWAFDTFLGERPPATDEIDSRPVLEQYRNEGPSGIGAFHEMCEKNGVPRNAYTAVEGYFDETLPRLGNDRPPRDIALAYVDCNLYSSTVSVLKFLRPRLKHGMIVAFDDYWVYKPAHVSGERLALHEFLQGQSEWNFVPYRELHHVGQSYIVEGVKALDRS